MKEKFKRYEYIESPDNVIADEYDCVIDKLNDDYEYVSKFELYQLANNQENLINKLKEENQQLKQTQKAIVLPFEFDKPFYKLCPKCNEQQTDCKHCAWGGCGFNQCYDICHKGNKGLIIREIIFRKKNCIVSWNAFCFIVEHWGEYYFATREEAEQKLAEIGEKDE